MEARKADVRRIKADSLVYFWEMRMIETGILFTKIIYDNFNVYVLCSHFL